MKQFSKNYNEEEHGFEGDCEAYLIQTNKENLKNWLEKEVSDDGIIYESIKESIDEVLIIKNINVYEEYQGQGFGTGIICDLLNDSYAKAAILLCDIGESQRNGFVLEKFYQSNNFSTVFNYNDYPLMIYPEELAQEIKQKINNKKISIGILNQSNPSLNSTSHTPFIIDTSSSISSDEIKYFLQEIQNLDNIKKAEEHKEILDDELLEKSKYKKIKL